MRRPIRSLLGLSLRVSVIYTSLAACAASEPPLDIALIGGRVVDGVSDTSYRVDVGVRGGKIVAIGDLSNREATRRVDVSGKVVAPGFVDMMGVASVPILVDPVAAESKLRQGITTMSVGEGGSHAPQNERTMPDEVDVGGRRVRWARYSEYFRLLEERGIALNVVHNVGAGQVRRIVIGDEDRRPSADELARMSSLVEEAMQDGAVGLSTSLIYPPDTYASTEEIIALARVAARYGGVYFTHMRNESSALLDAIAEALRIGEAAGIPVHIYHLKAAGEANWPLMSKALAAIRDARAQGRDVTADIYPYIRNGIGLRAFIPPRHFAAGAEPFVRTLRDPGVRARLRREVEQTSDWENWYQHVGRRWDRVLISNVGPNTDRAHVGRSITEVAAARGVTPWDAFFDLLEDENVTVNPESMNEAQKHEALREPFVFIDNDSPPMNPARGGEYAHPRGFGTFPRVLAKYVREDRVLTLEGAIRQMTSRPADRLKLPDRGRITVDAAADLVVFDPATIRDEATFAEPMRYATGVEYLIVNGRLVIDGGRMTTERPGQVLRRR